MQRDAHDDSTHNVLAKNHTTISRTLSTLQIHSEHTWEACDLVLQDASQNMDNAALSIYTAAYTLAGVARTQKSSFLLRLDAVALGDVRYVMRTNWRDSGIFVKLNTSWRYV